MPKLRRRKNGFDPASPDAQRSRVIKSAIKLFAKKGYDDTTVDEIAADMGATKGTVYHYFRSKHALLYEARIEVQTPFIEMLREVVASSAPPEEKLRRAIGEYVVLLFTDPAITAFNVEHFHIDSPLPPSSRAVINRRRAEVDKAFQSILDDGIAAGVFRPVDVSVVARTIVGAIIWTAYWFRPGGRLTSQELAGMVVDFLVAGLMSDSCGGSQSSGMARLPAQDLQPSQTLTGASPDPAPYGEALDPEE